MQFLRVIDDCVNSAYEPFGIEDEFIADLDCHTVFFLLQINDKSEFIEKCHDLRLVNRFSDLFFKTIFQIIVIFNKRLFLFLEAFQIILDCKPFFL